MPNVSNHLFRLVPAFDVLRSYSLRSLRLDVVAGLTVAAVAVPQAMAYASVAGLPPQYGLYTAIVMTAVGAIFASSRQLINGPTNAISIAVLSALSLTPNLDDKIAGAILLAFMVGLFQTVITLFRSGDLTRFISHSVIVGFALGAAALLVLDQLKYLFGLPTIGDPHDHFIVRFWKTMRPIFHEVHWLTFAVGVGTIAIVLSLRWIGHKIGKNLPELLLAVVAMAVCVWLGKLNEYGVAVVGDVPSHLPSFAWPEISWTRVRELSGSAMAIAVLGLLEALAMSKAIAAKTGQQLDVNQQCLSEGLANMAGSCFQCIPGSGSLTRSAINHQAGAVTQWSGVVAAAAVALTVVLLAPLAHFIPRAALAGILLIAAWRLVDRPNLMYHLRTTRMDAGIVSATALSAVFISVEFCILIGVFLSFVIYVPRAARLRMTELIRSPERVLRERKPSDPECSRIMIASLEGEMFFGAAPSLEKHFATIRKRCDVGLRVVVMRMKRVRNADAVCLHLLKDFIREMDERHVVVLFCGVRRDLSKVLRSSGLRKVLGEKRIFRERLDTYSSTLDAVRYAYEILGADVCAICPGLGDKEQILYYMI